MSQTILQDVLDVFIWGLVRSGKDHPSFIGGQSMQRRLTIYIPREHSSIYLYIYKYHLYSKGTGLNNDLSFEDVQGHGEDTQM